jgi:hypothetical protein
LFAGARPRGIWVLAAIAMLSLGLDLWHLGFPLGYHRDEPKKVRFILEGTQDFHHPLLMLQAVRGANRVAGLEDPQRVVELGRAVTGVAGTLAVLLVFALARGWVRPPYDYGAALAAAASPILVIHAHYLKEDVYLVLFALLTLWALFRALERPGAGRFALLGVALGLAGASHYKAALLVPVVLAAPFLGPGVDRRRALRGFVLAGGVAAAVFAVVNLPAFLHPRSSGIVSGMLHDLDKVREGNKVRVPALSQAFTFHLRRSLVPGMTAWAAVPALAAAAWALVRWPRLDLRERVLLLASVLFYAVIEASPSKPFPDFMRYAAPIVPFLLLVLAREADRLARRVPGRAGLLLPIALAVVGVALPLGVSLRLDRELTRDTRARVEAWAAGPGVRAWFGNYADLDSRAEITDADPDSLRRAGMTHMVVSSFDYDRYLLAGRLGGQHPEVMRRFRAYRALFRRPCREVAPGYRSFAFSNPTIRVVDLRKQAPSE